MTKLIRIIIPVLILFCFTDCTKKQNNIPSTTQSQPTNTTNPARNLNIHFLTKRMEFFNLTCL
jgi:hypothetical protein